MLNPKINIQNAQTILKLIIQENEHKKLRHAGIRTQVIEFESRHLTKLLHKLQKQK